MRARSIALVVALVALAIPGSGLAANAHHQSVGCAHGFPRPGCTGLPHGTHFKRVIHGDYTVTKPRKIDRWRVTGELFVEANGVRITNSEIDESVVNDTANGPLRSFRIRNSTVGPRRCGRAVTYPMAVGFGRFHATNVKVRGHEDGFRAAGPRITVRDSFYRPCVDRQSHGDGVQDYPSTSHLLLEHNTFDQSHIRYGYTAPIFVTAKRTHDVTIKHNLLLGGVYSLFIDPLHGRWVVSGNRIARGSWTYGAIDDNGDCRGRWADNRIAKVSRSYRLSHVGKAQPCG